MPNLYELMDEFAKLQESLDRGDGGVALEAHLTMIDEARGTLTQKVDNVCRVLRNLEAQEIGVKKEEQRLAARRKAIANNRERLREWVRFSMDVLDVDKIKTDLHSVTLSQSKPKLDVIDEKALPADYKKTVVSVDRAKLGAHFKETGEQVPGTVIIPGKRTLNIR